MMNKTAKACEKRPFVVIGGTCTSKIVPVISWEISGRTHINGEGAVNEDQGF
jgi:hypothetical protein